MNRKEFQELAVRTESLVDELQVSENDLLVFKHTLDAFVQLSEVLDVYKKHLFYRRPIDYDKTRRYLASAHRRVTDAAFMTTQTITSQERAKKSSTEHQPSLTKIDENVRVFHALLGTITEHGELAFALLESMKGNKLDLINVCEELGDSDWYKALFYEATGVDWETVQSMIIKKLEIRFSDKIFKEGEANERDLKAEREEMENMIQDQIDLFEG